MSQGKTFKQYISRVFTLSASVWLSVCNNVRNCKGGWDEENCGPVGSAIPLDFTAAHVIIILILLLLIMLGMCVGMVYNLVRKLSEDKEDILSSRDKSLASLASVESVPGVPSPPKSRASRLTDHTGRDDGSVCRLSLLLHYNCVPCSDCHGCYVPAPPDGGFPFSSKF